MTQHRCAYARPSGAARLLGDIADIGRVLTAAHFASWNGTAPIEASSGDQRRHRLSRLRGMLTAMIDYLGRHPGTCAGLLGALGATGQMSEVLQTNDTWIAGPLRDLLSDGQTTGAFTVHNATDAANAILGAILL